MTRDELTAREFQVRQAVLIEAVVAAVRRLWLSLGSWNAADVARFVQLVQPAVEAAGVQMAALVDASSARIAGTQPIGVASRLGDTIVNPRGVPVDDLWRRPFIEHWANLSDGKRFAVSIDEAVRRVETIAAQNVQMVMRESMAEVVAVHATEPELLLPSPDPDLDVIEQQKRLIESVVRRAASVDAVDQDALVDAVAAADVPQVGEVREIVGYRRTLTGRSCMFCAAASTRIYRRGDLMPLHAHCDCGVAPVLIGADPAFALNAQVLSNLKAKGKAYWKQSGFVDNDGNPIDPTDVPESAAASVDHPEVGPVLLAA